MEKLIELLNEYHHFNSDLIYYGWDKEYERVYFHTELPEEQKKKLAKAGIDDEGIDEERVYDEWLCSKKYGFIKWLVDNDKIEGETIGNYQSRTKLRTLTHTAGLWHDAEGKSELEYIKETFTDGLLMLLSISDTPIEDLISYLK